MMKKLMEEKAARYFAQGNNCCQSVLLAANDIWSLEISQDVIDASSSFREGMYSGCTCGALAGMEMALGIYQRRKKLSDQSHLSKQAYQSFTQTFGSSCCRVLKKKQGFLDKIKQDGCKKITGKSAGLLYEIIDKQNYKD